MSLLVLHCNCGLKFLGTSFYFNLGSQVKRLQISKDIIIEVDNVAMIDIHNSLQFYVFSFASSVQLIKKGKL